MVPGATVALAPCLLERPARFVTALEANSIDLCTTTHCCMHCARLAATGSLCIYVSATRAATAGQA